MVDKNSPPSVNPSNDGSLVGMMDEVLTKFLQGVDDMLPAKVVSFNRTTNRAKVQPLIAIITTSGKSVSRAPVASVPVFQIGGGGFILNFNLKPGDLGWIKANDRDISLFLQGYKNAPPNTLRKHSFEDCVFYPDVMKGFTIAEDDEESVVLQNLDGTSKIAISETGVTITSENIAFVSTTLTHNGINIGETHRHSGVDTGPSNTGEPI